MSDILSQSEEDVVKIVSDDEEISNPIFDKKHFDFIEYSETLAGIITNTKEVGYSIGIYGEWGSGKTTLMKLIEKKLKPIKFYWKDFELERPNRILSNEIKDCLKRKLEKNERGWLDNDLFFEKGSDGKSIVISNNPNNLAINLNSVDPHRVQFASLELDSTRCKLLNGSPYFKADYDNDNQLTITENNQNILTVWFNAWRYESEESYALIPLLKTLAYAISDHPKFRDLREKIIRALSIIGKDILRRTASSYFMTEKGITDLEKLQDRFDQSIEFDKNVLYFDGMKKIEEEMNKILTTDSSARIVIFIDDLDRCSPEHALEVFESIKVFLNIRGFVFVLGLSLEALNKLIEVRYQNLGLSGITGDQYIRKIIQVEVQIPTWTDEAIKALIDTIILKRISKKHSDILSDKENKELIRMAIGKNPREVKRYFNKLAVIMGSNPSIGIREYLVFEVLSKKWNSFFKNYSENIMRHPQFLKEIEKWSESSLRELRSYQRDIQARLKTSNEIYATDPYARIWAGITTEFLDKDLWKFVREHIEILGKKENVASYNTINETSNVILANPSPVVDMDLRSRRREAYKDLWPRFKLLFSDSRDPDVTYRGRSYIKDYVGIRRFSEQLQNWYYDLGGGMLMNENSRDAFFGIRTYIQSILASNAENSMELKKELEEWENLRDDQLIAKVRDLINRRNKRIGDKVKELRDIVRVLEDVHDEQIAKDKVDELRNKVEELKNIFNKQTEARIEELEDIYDKRKVEDKIHELKTAVEELDKVHDEQISKDRMVELRNKVEELKNILNKQTETRIEELDDVHDGITVEDKIRELKTAIKELDDVHDGITVEDKIRELKTAVEELDDVHDGTIRNRIRELGDKITKFEKAHDEHINARISELGDGHDVQLAHSIRNKVEELRKNVERYVNVENNLLTKVDLDEVRKRVRILLGTMSKDTGLS